MLKRICVSFMSALLVCGMSLVAFAYEGSGLDLTGKQWMQSTENEKLAFLYGASSVIVIEHQLAQKKGSTPSVFVNTWMKSLKDTSWRDLQKKLDAWYAAHPQNLDRPLFDVLWSDVMLPAAGK